MQYHGISTTRAARIQARVLNAIGSSHACTSTSDEATAATTMYDVAVSALEIPMLQEKPHARECCSRELDVMRARARRYCVACPANAY